MTKRILVITDNIESNWIDKAVSEGSRENPYDVLTLGIDGKIAPLIKQEEYQKLTSCKIININEFAEQAQGKIRQFIPSFIYEFPRKQYPGAGSIMELFKISEQVNLWWFTEMSEKGAERTPFIKRLYYFELIRKTLSKGDYVEIWLEIEDQQIIRLLSHNRNKIPPMVILSNHKKNLPIINRLSFLGRVLKSVFRLQVSIFASWLLIKIARIADQTKISPKSVLFFSFFPFFWIKSDQGYFENFYRSVPAKLGKSVPVKFAIWLSLSCSQIWQQRVELKNNIRHLRLVLIEDSLRLKDFVNTAFLSFSYMIKILKYQSSIRSKIYVEFEGYEIGTLVIAELEHSLQSAEMFKCVFIMKALKNLLLQNPVQALIYRNEFQPHERAVILGAKNKCLTVGFEHAVFSRSDLQHFFHPDEFNHLPLPDKLLVPGEYTYEVLRKAGYPAENIAICGPVRYAGLVSYKKEVKTKPEIRSKYGLDKKNTIFLIAIPAVKVDMLSLMLSLLQVLREYDKGSLFLFKSHPVFKFDQAIIDLINQYYPNMKYSFLADNINLNDYLVLADALLLTGTTMGIEAICLGTMPVLFDNASTFSFNPLLEISNAYWGVKGPEELKEALLLVSNTGPKMLEIKKHWPEAIRKLFGNIDDDPKKKFNDLLCRFIKQYNNQASVCIQEQQF